MKMLGVEDVAFNQSKEILYNKIWQLKFENEFLIEVCQ